jgi:hypothetical protein
MVNPIEIGIFAAGEVVIDVDEKVLIEAAKAGALGPIALEEDGGVIRSANAEGKGDGVGLRQAAIDDGDAVGSDQVGMLTQLADEHAHGQHAANGVAIRPRVGADEKALAFAQDLENSGEGINGWRKRRVGAAGSSSRF